ncbi:MAG: uL15 family ribosomal protein, partial [Eubacteriales bacterium]
PSFTVPAIPQKTGYSGSWAQYDLTKLDDIVDGVKTVNAVYTAITYTATFMADGNVVASVTFTVEDTSITPPAVPSKAGYTGAWDSYTLGAADITVSAIYTPIVYTATFVADGVVVGTVSFTVENKSISEPAVPAKEGFTGKWESYTLGTSDITINAVYTPVSEQTETDTQTGGLIGNKTFWWIIIVVLLVIIGVLAFFIISKKNGGDNTPTPGASPEPEPEPENKPEEEAVPEPEATPEPTPEPEPEPQTEYSTDEAPEVVPVIELETEVVSDSEKIDAQKADTMMTDDDALAAIEVLESDNAEAQAGGMKAVINIKDISENFSAGDTVDLDALKAKKLAPAKATKLKVLADGFIDKPVTVIADHFSVQAVKMIKLTGGTVIQKK